MTLKAQMAADLESVFFNTDDFAEPVDIESADGNDVYRNIPAIVDYGTEDDYGGTASILERARMIVPAAGENALPASKKGDTVTISGVVWTVELPRKSADGLTWEIELVK